CGSGSGAAASRERKSQDGDRDFKKSGHLLRSGIEVKYAFVENNRRQYGVPALCEALQVSRSGYYVARQRGPSDRQQRRVDLTARIRTIHQASRESYGAPRGALELPLHAVTADR